MWDGVVFFTSGSLITGSFRDKETEARKRYDEEAGSQEEIYFQCLYMNRGCVGDKSMSKFSHRMKCLSQDIQLPEFQKCQIEASQRN